MSLYELQGSRLRSLASGESEEIGSRNGKTWLKVDHELRFNEDRSVADAEEAAELLIGSLERERFPNPSSIGHRIVHGGPKLREHQLITPDVMAELEKAIPFAPLHVPVSLKVINYTRRRFPEVPNVACFDTVFHRTLPDFAYRLPLPKQLFEEGVFRYGFHGLSFEFIVDSLGTEMPSKTVVAHLGNGCSLCAIRGGKSVDTTMGLTPTGGLMMGTRAGDLDPGVTLHLLRELGYSAQQLDDLVNQKSGLAGVSGGTSDMRQLLEDKSADARLAVEMFCYSTAKFFGAMASALDGVELLVFTGGIGEHAAPIRSRICSRLGHLGILIDDGLNNQNARTISGSGSRCSIQVIPTDEDLQIARHCVKLTGGLS